MTSRFFSLLLAALLSLAVGAPALCAQAPLAPVLRQMKASVDAKRTPAAVVTLKNDETAQIARIEPVGIGDTPAYVVFQLDDVLRFPVARMGDSIFIYDLSVGRMIGAKVTELKAVKQVCDGESWDRTGWVYGISRPVASLIRPRRDTDEMEPFAYAAIFGKRITIPTRAAPSPAMMKTLQAHRVQELTRLYNEHRKIHAQLIKEDPSYLQMIRDATLGDTDNLRLQPSHVRTLVSRGKTLYAVGFAGDEPLNDESIASPYSLLYDEAGRSAGKLPLGVADSFVIDLEGDGSDEVFNVDSGEIAYHNDKEWVLTRRDQHHFPPCY